MTSALKRISPYIVMFRPYQWIKNILVFGGIIFSNSLLRDNALVNCIAAFIIFCTTSSGIYVLNDLRDVKQDRLHPEKKNRPIASGLIPYPFAITMMVLLLVGSTLVAFLVDRNFFIVLMTYVVLNISYSFGLKRVVILDAMLVAIGFLLRAIAGCAIIHVKVSAWLFICSLMLALLLSFGKRRNEMNVLKSDAATHRGTLQFYTTQLLDIVLAICGASSILTYSLYTMANETVQRFNNTSLIYTTPFVIYGVFRYFYLIYTKNKGGDPTKLLVTDIPTLINGVLWIISVVLVIYRSKLYPTPFFGA